MAGMAYQVYVDEYQKRSDRLDGAGKERGAAEERRDNAPTHGLVRPPIAMINWPAYC
jgi:hypothetical protein